MSAPQRRSRSARIGWRRRRLHLTPVARRRLVATAVVAAAGLLWWGGLPVGWVGAFLAAAGGVAAVVRLRELRSRVEARRRQRAVGMRGTIRGRVATPAVVGVLIVVALLGAGRSPLLALLLGALTVAAVAGGMFRRW